jgi:hypothetical protein
MKTIKGKIISKIALAFGILGICALIIFFVLPLDKPVDRLNLIVGSASAVAIFTVFSIFATVQEDKKLKK